MRFCHHKCLSWHHWWCEYYCGLTHVSYFISWVSQGLARLPRDIQFYFQDLSWRPSSSQAVLSRHYSCGHPIGISFQDLSWLEAGVPLSPTATVRRAARCRRFCPPLWPCRVPIEPPRSPGSNGGLSFVGGAAVRRRRSPEPPLHSGRRRETTGSARSNPTVGPQGPLSATLAAPAQRKRRSRSRGRASWAGPVAPGSYAKRAQGAPLPPFLCFFFFSQQWISIFPQKWFQVQIWLIQISMWISKIILLFIKIEWTFFTKHCFFNWNLLNSPFSLLSFPT